MIEHLWFFPALCPLVLGMACAREERLPPLEVSVTVRWPSDRAERVIEVELLKADGCFTAPPETRVSLNDEALTLVSAGRLRREMTARDLIPDCEPALFRSRPFLPSAARTDRVKVEIGRASGYADIEALRSTRTVKLLSPSPLVPGKEVVIEWTTRTDAWPRVNAGHEVRIEVEGADPVIVEGAALHLEDGRLSFTMPAVAPGPVALRIRPGEPGPRARVVRTEGLVACRTGVLEWPERLHTVVAPSTEPHG